MDDIKRHGPPKIFNKDAFEKNHAKLRNEIFHQNQKNRGRDTAKSFAQMFLLDHITSGGYFPLNDKWITCEEQIKNICNSNEVRSFIGKETAEKEGRLPVTKLKRGTNGKVITTPIEARELLQICLCLGLNSLPTTASLLTGSAVKTKRGELANEGYAIEYVNQQQEVSYGFMKEGVIYKLDQQRVIVTKLEILQKSHANHLSNTGCQIFQKTDKFDFVKPQKINRIVEIFHNCKAACRSIKESEGELTIKHRNVNSFILNKYKL